MIVTLKVTCIGDAKYLLLSQDAKEKVKKVLGIDFQKGDQIKIDILGVDNFEREILSYKCTACNYYFDQAEAIPYCPSCGKEETIKEIDDQEMKGGKEE